MKFSTKTTVTKKANKVLGIGTTSKGKLTGKNNSSAMIKEIREEFAKKGPVKAKQAIIQDVARGVSPVKGKGKFKKYSESYKAQIRGEAIKDANGNWITYRTIGGKVVPMRVKKKKLSFRNRLQEKAVTRKMVSPVNLRLSGGLTRSLKVFATGGFTSSFRLIFHWKHFLANIHNSRGAGKSKVIRRMLPTEKGERFNRRIELIIFDELKKATDTVVKRYS